MKPTFKILAFSAALLTASCFVHAQANYWNLGSTYFDCNTGMPSSTPSNPTDLYPDAFVVPGLCNTYYRVYWSYIHTTPSFNALTLYDISSSTSGHPFNSLYPANQADLINNGAMHDGTSVAVAPISSSGDRKIFAIEDYQITEFTVYANGTVSSPSTFYSGAIRFESRTPAEVSSDGVYLTCVGLGGNVYTFDINSGTMTTYTVPLSANTTSMSNTITGIEYVANWVSGNPRLYVTWHDGNAWPSPVGGLGYFDIGNPNFNAIPSYPAGTTDFKFGFSEIELAKNNDLYIAYNNNPLGAAGILYSYTSAGTWNAVAGVSITNGVGGSWAYGIQTQIDGEDYNAGYYRAPSFPTVGTLSGTLLSPSFAPLPTVYHCSSGTFVLSAPILGLVANATASFTPGTVVGGIFYPSPNTYNVTMDLSGTFVVYDLSKVTGLDNYAGVLRITINIADACGGGTTQVYYANIQNATVDFRFQDKAYSPITSTGTPILGATSGAVLNFIENVPNPSAITSYSLTVYDPMGASLGNITSTTGFASTIVDFNSITGNYFTSNFSAYSPSNPTFSIEYKIIVTGFGTLSKTAWFKIDPTSKYYRMIASQNNGSKVTLSPNPVENQLQIQWTAAEQDAGNASLQLMDMLGRIVLTKQWTVTKGNNMHIIDVANIPVGLYHYSFSSTAASSNGKLIKK